jgi:hypothetical protein
MPDATSPNPSLVRRGIAGALPASICESPLLTKEGDRGRLTATAQPFHW